MKKILLLNIIWIIAIIGLVVIGAGLYTGKTNEMGNLQDTLKQSTLKLEKMEDELKDIAYKKASYEEQNKILIEQLNNAKKDIAVSEERKDDKDKYINGLKEENASLKKEVEDVKTASESRIYTEKERFENELKIAKENYSAKLKDVIRKVEGLKAKTDFLAQKKETLENVIIQAMADAGRERMKLYHYQKGLSYEYGNRYEEAIEEYKKVLKLDPDNPDTYLQLAGLYTYKIKDLEQAEVYAKGYARLAPQSKLGTDNIQGKDVKLSLPYLKDKLADVALMNVTLENKIAGMKDVVKKKQGLVNNLQVMAKRNKVISKQLKQIEETVKKESLKFHYNLAVMYDRNGDYKNACKEYLESLKVSSDDPDTHYNLAIIYDDHLDDKKRAIEHYERYLELSPAGKDAKKVEYWITRAKKEVEER